MFENWKRMFSFVPFAFWSPYLVCSKNLVGTSPLWMQLRSAPVFKRAPISRIFSSLIIGLIWITNFLFQTLDNWSRHSVISYVLESSGMASPGFVCQVARFYRTRLSVSSFLLILLISSLIRAISISRS